MWWAAVSYCWFFVCLHKDWFVPLSNNTTGFFFDPMKCTHGQHSDFNDYLNLYWSLHLANQVAAPDPDSAGKNTLLPKREKIQRIKLFVSSPSWSCEQISPPPSWEMVQKQTATGQDVVILSLHYLQPTSQTTDHNKCLSYHSPIYFVFQVFVGHETIYSRDREEILQSRMKNKKRANNIKRYRCISCCYRCAPPAGVNSDQRPFIIWCC